MKKSYLHDQRGVAMVLELVLVAAVLGLVGLALYQSSQHTKEASTTNSPKAAIGAGSLVNSAEVLSNQDSAADDSLSASAETTADAATEADIDVTNLGGSSESTF
jgi:Tfp pilus assembly protein PilV